MNRPRLVSIALISAAALALAGCGGEETATPTSSTPTASAVAPTSAAASPSVAPSSPAAGGAPVTVNEKVVCESAEKAGQEMKKALIAVVQSGKEPSAEVYRKILADLGDKLTSLLPAGGVGEVVGALTRFASEAGRAAAAADPATAADNPAFEKAGTDLTAACKAAGVKVNF
ncbi:hypothetical protein ACFOOK_13910 [Micromonospora krabiensis]|uniref:Lipoprotein n=1 Tax=Micromonospora krabiensis TaxID=307121 RepID=A0A1C3N1L4_9ACTN|nr:hypothetical protein [Micromonospora krabiensis]SBV26470.1 hypothetical protein GA0070620_1959 [Micromonospora krabiensis]